MAIVALFAGVIGYAFMRGGNQTVGLQAAQSSLVGLLTLARSQAAVSGRETGLFVSVASDKPDRYLRYLVVAWDDGGTWKPLDTGTPLPLGCFVVPRDGPDGDMMEVGTEAKWAELHSTSLNQDRPDTALNSSDTGEDWIGIVFTPRGTTTGGGQIVLANGRMSAPGTDPSFVFVNPDNVRGAAVSVYGLARVVNDYEGFQ